MGGRYHSDPSCAAATSMLIGDPHGRGQLPGVGGSLGWGCLLRPGCFRTGCHTGAERWRGAGPLGSEGCVAVQVATLATRGVLQRPDMDARARVRTFLDGRDRPEKRKVGGSTPPLPTRWLSLLAALWAASPGPLCWPGGLAPRTPRGRAPIPAGMVPARLWMSQAGLPDVGGRRRAPVSPPSGSSIWRGFSRSYEPCACSPDCGATLAVIRGRGGECPSWRRSSAQRRVRVQVGR